MVHPPDQKAEERPRARAIIRAILALGRSLDVPILAEGVASDRQLTLLEAEGCDEGQGHLFGRSAATPSTLDEAAIGRQIRQSG